MKKKQLQKIRNKFGSHLTYLSYLEYYGVTEEHSEDILQHFVDEFGFLFLEGMNATEFRDLLSGIVQGYNDHKARREEFCLNDN